MIKYFQNVLQAISTFIREAVLVYRLALIKIIVNALLTTTFNYVKLGKAND